MEVKKKSGRIIKYSALVLFIAILIYLLLPQNYYIHKALLNLFPKIDNGEIFEHRVVKASNPQPWKFSENFNKVTIPEKYLEEFEELGTIAFVVIQHNQIVFEQYWDDFDQQSRTNSFSMAKGVLSLLVGAAIQDGYIKSVDQAVQDFLPEWTDFQGDTLKIKHLLTMSAGVDWDESYSSLFSKTTQAYYGKDLWGLTQTEKLIEKPGVVFNYQSGVSMMIAFLLQKATGKSISEYASVKLWTPMGAEEDAWWSTDKKDGMEKAYCCYHSNARDFARLGQLLLNKGKWNNVQLIDSVYLEETITPASYLTYIPKPSGDIVYKPRPNTFYGYQMWIANYHDMQIPFYRGILGQYVFAVPELDAVIVRLGHKRSKVFNIEQNHTLDVETWINAGLDILNK